MQDSVSEGVEPLIVCKIPLSKERRQLKVDLHLREIFILVRT